MMPSSVPSSILICPTTRGCSTIRPPAQLNTVPSLIRKSMLSSGIRPSCSILISTSSVTMPAPVLPFQQKYRLVRSKKYLFFIIYKTSLIYNFENPSTGLHPMILFYSLPISTSVRSPKDYLFPLSERIFSGYKYAEDILCTCVNKITAWITVTGVATILGYGLWASESVLPF